MYRRNSKGHRTFPCGTPDMREEEVDDCPNQRVPVGFCFVRSSGSTVRGFLVICNV